MVKRKKRYSILLFTAFLLLAAHCCLAQTRLRLPAVIGNNMILQRDKKINIWGIAQPGDIVTVAFKNKIKSTTTNINGNWSMRLDAEYASVVPSEMTISTNDTVIKLRNILVGEVWLCSGQSNMEYSMKRTYQAPPSKGIDSAALELNSHNNEIRLFKAETSLANKDDVTSNGWSESAGDALEKISTVGFYFVRNIHEKLHVPVGLISSSWGGTKIEPWSPLCDSLTKGQSIALSGNDPNKNGILYEHMIRPLGTFGIRGVIWYQGESNCVNGDSINYAVKERYLINSWRKQWKEQKLPFYTVMLAPFNYTKHKSKEILLTAENLPKFREAQCFAASYPYTGIICITDLVDDLNDVHPSYKWVVGRRLALLALSETYGFKDIEFSGPRFRKCKRKGNNLVIYFTHSEGLKSSDGQAINWFSIAGSDGNFEPAEAHIDRGRVILSSPKIVKPLKVRYGWSESAVPNLGNSANMPAFPFESDCNLF